MNTDEQTHNASIVYRRDITPGLAVFRVAPDGWRFPDFKPGQYATLGLPQVSSGPGSGGYGGQLDGRMTGRLLKRSYSIASTPNQKEYLEFYVNRVQGGVFTPHLFELGRGDRLWLKSTAKGVFTLSDVPQDKHVLMVATGTGLAPYLSMLRTTPWESTMRRYMVLLGVRRPGDIAYRDELSTLRDRHPAFEFLPIASRPTPSEDGWQGPMGHVRDLWRDGVVERALGFRPTPGNTHAMLSGNPAMIRGMIALLKREGFVEIRRRQPGQIQTEHYWQISQRREGVPGGQNARITETHGSCSVSTILRGERNPKTESMGAMVPETST